MKRILVLIGVLSVVGISSSFAKDGVQGPALKQTLSSVPAAELPAKSAEMVQQAKARDWGTTTVNVVKAAVGLNPAAAPAIVGAIAKAVPDMAALAASTAAAEQPKLASAIAKAAAAAAPSKAGKVVMAVCRAVPNEYRNVAVAVSQAVPGSNREVLRAVESALPNLKPGIENALASYNGAVPSVAAALEVATTMPQAKAGTESTPVANNSLPKGPTIGPPYQPLSGTPANVTAASSGEVPTGGRDYARP